MSTSTSALRQGCSDFSPAIADAVCILLLLKPAAISRPLHPPSCVSSTHRAQEPVSC